jgi:hypothetical protein
MKTIQTIWLSKADRQRAKSFAKKRVEADVELYKKRGGFKEIDIVSGAMAELAVYRFLKEKGLSVKFPDLSIHDTNKKSYDADLTDGLHKFHVKGQTLESKEKYGASWLMQRSDPIINKPKRLNYLIPCTVCTDTGRVEIYGIISIMALVDNGCIGECKVPWFQKTKVALYMDHIEGILTDTARWHFLRKWKKRFKKYKEEK